MKSSFVKKKNDDFLVMRGVYWYNEFELKWPIQQTTINDFESSFLSNSIK